MPSVPLSIAQLLDKSTNPGGSASPTPQGSGDFLLHFANKGSDLLPVSVTVLKLYIMPLFFMDMPFKVNQQQINRMSCNAYANRILAPKGIEGRA